MGIIFKDKEPKDKKEKVIKEQSNVQIQSYASVTPQTINNIAGVADDKFVALLWDAIAQNNIPGQDYFEFKQSIDAMASLPIDEKNKFLTTFTVFTAQGCKKETLLSSIDTYIKIIKKEQKDFTNELESQLNQKVRSKQAQVEQAKKKVEELNKQIIEANNFILTASQEAQQEELKLQMTSANFNQSAEKVLAVLESDKNKINTYLL